MQSNHHGHGVASIEFEQTEVGIAARKLIWATIVGGEEEEEEEGATRKTWLALSLRVESSGLSTGGWLVNLESNWLKSSADCCRGRRGARRTVGE